MLTEAQIIEYGLTFDGAQVRYPYGRTPLVLSTPDSHEFCEIYEGTSPLHLVMKSTPAEAEALRAKYSSVQPGYRCNKRHWNSVFVDGTIPDEEIKEMLRTSYNLSCKLKKGPKNTPNPDAERPEAPPRAPDYEFEF